MTIKEGTKFGRYEIRSLIGVGGMGEVYRASDPKIGRDVAIKVLPADFSADKERVARFEQEAQAAGALSHPNILPIYDIDSQDGVLYVVSELLEGEELRQRLDEGPIPLRKVTEYAQQIVSGLSAAHEKGIVHRDLKPENLFITKDDRVKILDFGLAKLSDRSASAGGSAASEDATRAHVKTNPGVVMGTVGYMSPEQVRGQMTDHRSDIFSFGLILYEMITGRRAFQEESLAETMSAIVKDEPPEMTESNPNISPSLERIVRRCLEKKPDRRFQSTADLGFALESLSAPTSSSGSNMTTAVSAIGSETERSAWRSRIPWIVAAVLFLVAGGALLTLFLRRPAIDERPTTFVIAAPDKTSEVHMPVVSPDGRTVAFLATAEGKQYIYVRPLDSISATRLAGTEAADRPFWSPDSHQIGFFSGGKLKKVEAAGGPVQTVCDVKSPTGGTWNRENVILFAEDHSGIQRISASGGTPTRIVELDAERKETTLAFPTFLPDGRRFLFYGYSSRSVDTAIFTATIDGSERKLLLKNDSNAAYAAPGYLLFARSSTLMAQRFDAAKLELSGEAFPVLENVRFIGSFSYSNFSVSETGTLIFLSGGGSERQLAWFDRAGKEISTAGPTGQYNDIVLSPDEKKAAIQRVDGSATNIWLMDLVRGVPSRFTFRTSGDDDNPAWSPDGSVIIYSSTGEGQDGLYRKNSSGAGAEELLAQATVDGNGSDWSPDGKNVLFQSTGAKTLSDLWILPLTGDMKPFPLMQTEFNEHHGRFSPDGRYLAYVSDESGGFEVYVQNFPLAGGKWQVSTGGGAQPHWRRDGKELFYIAPDKSLMAVDVKTSPAFEASTPHPLFHTRVTSYESPNRYAVSADGQRFLINSSLSEVNSTPLTVILNWTSQLRK